MPVTECVVSQRISREDSRATCGSRVAENECGLEAAGRLGHPNAATTTNTTPDQ